MLYQVIYDNQLYHVEAESYEAAIEVWERDCLRRENLRLRAAVVAEAGDINGDGVKHDVCLICSGTWPAGGFEKHLPVRGEPCPFEPSYEGSRNDL